MIALARMRRRLRLPDGWVPTLVLGVAVVMAALVLA